jgi:hypothetical protein
MQFGNTCDCLVDYSLLSRAILHKFPHLRHKKVQKRSIGPYGSRKQPAISVTVNGVCKQYAVARILAEYLWPELLQDGKVVHHRDGNPLNNEVGNLVLLAAGEHMSVHVIRKGPSKVLMDNKEEISQLYQQGWTILQLAQKYNCCQQTILSRLREWGVPQRVTLPRKLHSNIGIWVETKAILDELAVKRNMTRLALIDKLIRDAQNESSK